jgi:enterobactin synthetase component F
MARDYVERLLAVRPRGPWHLAGWSVGGIIAQEMAVRLSELGQNVGLMAMFDSYPAECWRAQPEPDAVAALRSLLAIAGYDPEAYPELQSREAIIAFLRAGDSPLGRLPPEALDGVIRVVLDTNRLVRGHHHRAFGGVTTHIHAGPDHVGKDLKPEMWTPYSAGLDVKTVPFLHSQLTGPAASEWIAPLLDERMSAAETPRPRTD